MASKNHIRAYPQHSRWRRHLSQFMLPNDAQEVEINVGQRLQELRQMRGLSQRALAEMSGLNFNTLSLIENQKTSPNVSTLQQLAESLDVPITAFFESIKASQPVVYQESGKRPQTAFPQGLFEDLGGGLALGEATPLLMTLHPNHESDPHPIVHTGQEFIYCLTGEMVFWVDGEQYILEPDDSLIFEAQLPHRCENRDDKVARAIVVISPADRDDRSVAQHLA